MRLSLSVRIVEQPCKTKLYVPVADFVGVARDCGYEAICMRASAAGVQSHPDELAAIRRRVEKAGLEISMVTADFDVPLNNAQGPASLADIGPSLDVAERLGADLLRVCLKRPEDLVRAQQAADEAASRGLRLAHQCHTSSLFERVDDIVGSLQAIGRDNFGLIYEPANLLLCGQEYGSDAIARLRPYVMNAYAQNHRLDDDGPEMLETYCRGPVRFHHLDLWESGGVEFDRVFEALRLHDYDGYFTVHQAQGIQTLDAARDFAYRCAKFLRECIAGAQPS